MLCRSSVSPTCKMAAHVSRQPPLSPRKSYPSSYSMRSSLHDDDLQPCPKPAFVPTPTPLSALDLSDPSLCLTPEKSSVRKPLNTNTNANRSLDSSRGSQKVRFDSTVEIKTMSPHETSNETSKNTSSTLTDLSDDTMELIAQANDYVSPYLNTSAVSSSSSDNSKVSSDSKSSNVTVTSCASEDVDFVRVTADDVHADERHIYGKKLAQHRRSCAVRTSMWGEDGMGDNVLAKPEFNSTLTLKKQLDGIKAEELDIEDEVEQKLAASEALRNKLNEKVIELHCCTGVGTWSFGHSPIHALFNFILSFVHPHIHWLFSFNSSFHHSFM